MYKKHVEEVNGENIKYKNSFANSLWTRIEQEYTRCSVDNALKIKTVDKDLKTIRIFISSTFKDFYNEREVLVKSVFPKLRKWCEEQGLFLVECDLRWGVPSDATNLEAVSYCLDEIEKSREETNNHNFFLCLIGDRFGWVPDEEGLLEKLKMKYDFIEESSVTLMEIVHGVIRTGTENSLFMMRSTNILNDIPKHHLQFYEEVDENMKYNVEEQKKFIGRHFSKLGCVKEYKINFQSTVKDPVSGKERLIFTDFEEFSTIVEDYFKKQISDFKKNFNLSTAVENENEDMIHKSFLLAINKDSLKRPLYLQSLSKQVHGIEENNESNNPIVLLSGEAGSGKSTTMGNFIEYFQTQNKTKVFYHFCGASNLSHTQSSIVKRFKNFIELNYNLKNNEPNEESDMEESKDSLKDLFKRSDIPKTMIFIDAVDELWDIDFEKSFPTSTSKNILLLISCLHDKSFSSVYSRLTNGEYSSKDIPLEKMDKEQLSRIISSYLNNFGKRLDSKQMNELMNFQNADNPLWLLSACEELRMYGDYSSLTKLILSLPPTIADINRMVIKRITAEDKSNVIKTLLQLLVISRAGLWESLVRNILAAILDYSEPVSHSLWSDVVWQLKGFLQIQTIPLPLIKLRHRVMKESIEAELAMQEEFQLALHLKMSDFLEKLLDNSKDMFFSDFMYHLIKAEARNRLIEFMRSRKSWELLKQPFIRSKIMMSMRCINQTMNLPQEKPRELMMCVFCANKSGDLSIYTVNKNSCFYCGGVVFGNLTQDSKLFPCQMHKSHSPQMLNCGLCDRIIAGTQGEALRICHICKAQSLPGKCGVIVKENDILYRQQLGFSKSVYKIELLV